MICNVCSTPTHDTFLCTQCWAQLAEALRDLSGYQTNDRGERLIPLAIELDVTLSRQERRSKVALVVSGTPEKPLPVNLHAGRVRDRLEGVLAGWVTNICLSRVYCQNTRATMVQNAQWLLAHEHDVRGLHNVEELFASITEAIELAHRVIDNQSVRVYVGACGAELEEGVCTAPLWADSAYAMTRCSLCDTSWPSMERWEQYLAQVKTDRLAEVRSKQLGARRLATVLTALGHTIDEATVRKWAKAGKLAVVGLDAQGRKVYRAGDVLALLDPPASAAA